MSPPALIGENFITLIFYPCIEDIFTAFFSAKFSAIHNVGEFLSSEIFTMS